MQPGSGIRSKVRPPAVGFRQGVWGLGFRVWGLGFRVEGLGFGVEGLGLRVQGSGFGMLWLSAWETRVRMGGLTCMV